MAKDADAFGKEGRDVLRSIRMNRIILPVILGVGVVLYLFYRRYDPSEFARIHWETRVFTWIGVSVLILVVRHLAYAARLRILSEKAFSWRKCIELIFIWEFSSAVSPTSIGGSAVAFFVLAQEKLSTAKTATIVLYTVVLDTIFFVGSLPFLLLFFGFDMIRPNLSNLDYIDGWGFTFFTAYVVMAVYGSIFYYGLFIDPRRIKQVLVGFTRLRFLRPYRPAAVKLGNDMIAASKDLKRHKWSFHIAAFLATATAWSCRFILLNCLIIAFVPGMPLDAWTQGALYARLEAMFVIIAFSPTPGGAGFVEILFGGFLSDYVKEETFAIVISSIWRLLSYYSYLLIGVIIIPNWIRNRLNERSRARKSTSPTKPDMETEGEDAMPPGR